MKIEAPVDGLLMLFDKIDKNQLILNIGNHRKSRKEKWCEKSKNIDFLIHGLDIIDFTDFIDTFKIWKTGEKCKLIA